MPRGDGTGPIGQGAGSGRGMGMGAGSGRGMGMGAGGGRMGGTSQGTGGSCVCPRCGKQLPHQRGVPCNQMKCPACGSEMAREA